VAHGDSDDRDDRGDVVALVQAHLEWEEQVTGMGLPGVPQRLRQDPSASVKSPSREARSSATTDRADRAGGREPRERDARLAQLRVVQSEAAACTRCGLHAGRTQSVFSRGDPFARLAFVGEGPGYHEDQQGVPFVGRAGQLLDKMIVAMGLAPEGVYICNVVKCRPPENRTPLPDESAACMPFLQRQLQLVAPRVIVALGRCAAEALGCAEAGDRGWRGTWKQWEGIPVMSTYHPAFLLRSPQFKRPVWEDLQQVMRRLQDEHDNEET
jgi:uracil-DNA glycosylase family 4